MGARLDSHSYCSFLHFSSWRQPIKNSSRVPAYQNTREIGGFCDFEFKPPTMWGEV